MLELISLGNNVSQKKKHAMISHYMLALLGLAWSRHNLLCQKNLAWHNLYLHARAL